MRNKNMRIKEFKTIAKGFFTAVKKIIEFKFNYKSYLSEKEFSDEKIKKIIDDFTLVFVDYEKEKSEEKEKLREKKKKSAKLSPTHIEKNNHYGGKKTFPVILNEAKQNEESFYSIDSSLHFITLRMTESFNNKH